MQPYLTMKVSGKTHGFMITNKDYFLSKIFNTLKSIFEQPGQLKWEADKIIQTIFPQENMIRLTQNTKKPSHW